MEKSRNFVEWPETTQKFERACAAPTRAPRSVAVVKPERGSIDTRPIVDDAAIDRLLELRRGLQRRLKHPGEDPLRELLDVFEADSAARVATLKALVVAGDNDGVRLAAHALKGAAANLGAQRVAIQAERLEIGNEPRTEEAVLVLERGVNEALVVLRRRLA
jgi:HPt (histidine-containing phosphotransfer) domain-containing protein